MGNPAGDIKTMGLYRNVERIVADLRAAGHPDGAPLRVDDLTPYDQYHYEGTEAVDDAIAALSIGPESNVLDIGSGLGGPSRYVADRTGAHVTALELQADLDATAAELTGRCGLADRVQHRNGDVLLEDLGDEYDAIMSMLCFLHIPDRTALFAACRRALRNGGAMFIDDFVALDELTEDERAALDRVVYCTHLPDLVTYRADVVGAGFSEVRTEDKSADWTAFVVDRYAAFQSAADQLRERYDGPTVDGLDEFYGTIAQLFAAGRVGGLRLTAAA